jgi:Fanconi anemia group D2 protein
VIYNLQVTIQHGVFSVLQTLDNVKNSSEHLVIDVFAVLILYAVTSKRKPVESLLRNKIRSGCFTEDVLSMAFKSYGQV